jgi:hypothetical protein
MDRRERNQKRFSDYLKTLDPKTQKTIIRVMRRMLRYRARVWLRLDQSPFWLPPILIGG